MVGVARRSVGGVVREVEGTMVTAVVVRRDRAGGYVVGGCVRRWQM